MHCLGFGWSGPVSVGKVPVSDQINLEMKKSEKLKIIFASNMKKKNGNEKIKIQQMTR